MPRLMDAGKRIAPRLHVLLARKSPMAVVIRRGPSTQTAAIGWDRATDTFTLGQWLKGRIYPFRSDISPDGTHWIYFAYKKTSGYTVMAKTPYLKAVDFHGKGDCYDGGGLFLSNSKYWLNDRYFVKEKFQHQSAFRVTLALPEHMDNDSCEESHRIYFPRLLRDGWCHAGKTKSDDTIDVLTKEMPAGWLLIKHFTAGKREAHLLRNGQNGATIAAPDWEWAEWDGTRLLWAEQGRIKTGTLSSDGLHDVRELFDANPLTFVEAQAPY